MQLIAVIVVLCHWFTRGRIRKALGVLHSVFNKKPFTCTKCMVFWTSVITFSITGEYELILPTFVIGVIYEANYY